MSLTGIILDVSGSMQRNIGSGIDEQGEPWVQSIFKVIDDLIEHDLTSENRIFAIGIGASCTKQIFDVIGTAQQIENMKMPDYQKNMPATTDHINTILNILERNGARNIRKWAHDGNLIQDTVSDHMAALILAKLETDKLFLSKFVHEFLPSACREVPTVSFLQSGLSFMLGKRSFRPDTKEEIGEIVDKVKCYFLKDVEPFSVKNASRINSRCVDEKELSSKRKQELLENFEPFIYGSTPLYESLEKATKFFQGDTSENKLLFVLSDGMPTDGSNEDWVNQIISKLTEAGVKIVSCFINSSKDIDPKRLYGGISPDWEPGAKFLFSLSSEVPTHHLPRAILVKRGWTIDIDKNKTKLFTQVNHPDNLREVCKMAQDVCRPDALSELLVSVDLDIYISQSTSGFEVKKQQGGTCYVNASAAVLHLAMQRILGRGGGYPDFDVLKDDMIETYGMHGSNTSKVLQEICPEYRLHSQKVNIKRAKEAIVKKCPVVARFRLTDDEWKVFSNFYKNSPTGILTQNELDVLKRPTSPSPYTSGHAVVLTSYNSRCLTFMNSWGEKWGDKGFFRVQNAEVLQLEFFDVYWELDDLTKGEKEYYRKHGCEVAAKLMKSLKGLQNTEYTCPKCEQSSLVTEFEGTLSKVRCPKCSREFSTNDNAGNILALNMYLTFLSR